MLLTAKDIQHGFGKRAHDIVDLFDKTNKVATFVRKLNIQGDKDPIRYDRDKYVGDGLEFLVNIFLKTSVFDKRININNYEPVESDDNGVDGIGYNALNELCAVQIKFRSDRTSTLTANRDHLSNFISDALFKYNIARPKNTTDVPKHYVFTTAKGLNFYTDHDMFKGYVKCYGIDDMREFLDNNLHFWNMCRQIANELKK